MKLRVGGRERERERGGGKLSLGNWVSMNHPQDPRDFCLLLPAHVARKKNPNVSKWKRAVLRGTQRSREASKLSARCERVRGVNLFLKLETTLEKQLYGTGLVTGKYIIFLSAIVSKDCRYQGKMDVLNSPSGAVFGSREDEWEYCCRLGSNSIA